MITPSPGTTWAPSAQAGAGLGQTGCARPCLTKWMRSDADITWPSAPTRSAERSETLSQNASLHRPEMTMAAATTKPQMVRTNAQPQQQVAQKRCRPCHSRAGSQLPYALAPLDPAKRDSVATAFVVVADDQQRPDALHPRIS